MCSINFLLIINSRRLNVSILRIPKRRYTVDTFHSLAKHLCFRKQLNSLAFTADNSRLIFWDFIHIGGLLRIKGFNNAEILQIWSS